MKNKTQENENKTIIPKQKKQRSVKKEKSAVTKKTAKNQKQQHGSQTGGDSCTDGSCDHGIKCDQL